MLVSENGEKGIWGEVEQSWWWSCWCWEGLEESWGEGGEKDITSHGDLLSLHTCVCRAGHVRRGAEEEEEEGKEESSAFLRILICRSLSLSVRLLRGVEEEEEEDEEVEILRRSWKGGFKPQW